MDTVTVSSSPALVVTAVERYVTCQLTTSMGAGCVTMSPSFGHFISFGAPLFLSAAKTSLLAAHTKRVLTLQESSADLDRITRPTDEQNQPLPFDPDDYPLTF